ncbi:MAG: amidohydrolase family protein [Bacteroidia bacterium]
MPLLTADHIYSPQGLLQGHALETDSAGTILDLRPLRADETPTTSYAGVLCPGFVNAHCHLELSVLAGAIPEGVGMTGFVAEIVRRRGSFDPARQAAAILPAMERLLAQGTVAVGDICNTDLSLDAKRQLPGLFTYSFIELLGLDGAKADEVLARGQALADRFGDLPHALTLHAPYSVSPALRDRLLGARPARLSIHLLESQAERELFETGGGDFPAFFAEFQLPYRPFPTPDALAHITAGMDSGQPLLLVHNTELRADECEDLCARFREVSFCLCPRSNYYLHRRYPDLGVFAACADRLCLGTDSLASNHSLDVFEEARALHLRFPGWSLHALLRMLTTQGAAALGQEGNLGIFAPGKRPGINLITGLESLRLGTGTQVHRLY